MGAREQEVTSDYKEVETVEDADYNAVGEEPAEKLVEAEPLPRENQKHCYKEKEI